MKYAWNDYKCEDAQLVEGWIDDEAHKYTGCDDGFNAFFEYLANSGEMIVGKDFWCKVILEGREPFGVIALNMHSGTFTVMEYIIAPNKRGKGYGSSALMELLEFGQRIIGHDIDLSKAVIFPSNIASKKAFEKAGFCFSHAHPDGDALYYKYEASDSQSKDAIAYCGLACCVCSESTKCVGCQRGGCDIHGWCKNYNCCREKGLSCCWECADFPCSGTMLDKPRIRTFASFAKEYGTNELARCLLRNRERGIIYHYDGQHVGDYDKCETEEEIISMIKTGVRHGK